jgi:hypothetical protein
MNTSKLLAQSQRFVQALDELGFNADAGVSGADTVDVICWHLPLLNKLPALCELADAVGTFLSAKVPEDGSYSQIIEPLLAAHTKLKGA